MSHMFNSNSSYYASGSDYNILKNELDELKKKIDNLYTDKPNNYQTLGTINRCIFESIDGVKKDVQNCLLPIYTKIEELKKDNEIIDKLKDQFQNINIKLDEQTKQNQELLSKLEEQIKLNGELCKRLFELKN